LIKTIPALEALEEKTENAEEKIGVKILKEALEKPLWWIVNNAGQKADAILEEVKKKKDNIGYDVLKNEFVDMIASGIIDPVKVTRTAVENAVSIGTMIATTEALITDIPEKEKTPPMPPGGGMGEY